MKKLLVIAIMLVLLVGCGAKYTAGTYTGEAQGYGGTVKVTVTVSDKEITEIVAEGASETASIGGIALEKLPAKALAAQSAEIDAMSGATYTSEAFKTALAAALEQAK